MTAVWLGGGGGWRTGLWAVKELSKKEKKRKLTDMDNSVVIAGGR